MDHKQTVISAAAALAALCFCHGAASEVIIAADTTDRIAMIDTDAVTKLRGVTGDAKQPPVISFVVLEVFNSKQSDGAESISSTVQTYCKDGSQHRYLVISRNKFSSKDGKPFSITNGDVSVESPTPIDVAPHSAERLIADSACWVAFGKPKGLPMPDFGLPPKDAVRLTCETRFSENDRPMSLEFAFHESTGRVFLRNRFAVGASITKDQIALPLFSSQGAHQYIIRRTTGQVTLITSVGIANGACQRVANNKF